MDTENSLFEHTRKHVEKTMAEITGTDDFMPILAVRCHDGQLVAAGLMMCEEPHGKDMIAWTMAAICAIHRATEAAFTSCAWMVTRQGDAPMPDLPPSECPDRQEIAMISMLDADGKGTLHTAPIIRENNMAGVGLWEESLAIGDSIQHSGRFVDAIRIGMDMGRQMPEELAAFVDSQIEKGQQDALIETMVNKFLAASKGVQN